MTRSSKSSKKIATMSGAVLKRLSYANVTATVALFVALGGGAYAAVSLPPDSVGNAQLKENAVGWHKIMDNAVGSKKVIDGSLLSTDFKAGQLPAGPAGPAGPQGPAGGVSGVEVVYAASAGGPFTVKSSEATCPTGKKVTGGGYLIVGDQTNARVTVSTPGQVPNPTSWYVQALEPTATGAPWTLYAYAVCATASSPN